MLEPAMDGGRTNHRHLPAVMEMPSCVANAADAASWMAEASSDLLYRVRRHGAVLLRRCPVESADQFEAVCRVVTPDLIDYRGGGAFRQAIGNRIYNSTEYPADQPIPLHCESSYFAALPGFIWFFCDQPPSQQGETPIGDMARVLQRLDPALVERFDRKGLRYIYNLHDGNGFGRGWADAFQTTDPAVVETWLIDRDISFRWEAGSSLRVEMEAPALRVHPESGVTVWGNQAANWHPASLAPATAQAIRRLYDSPSRYPKYVTFADGDPIPDADIRHILQILTGEEIVFPWAKGDILLCDNHRTAHGRRPFKGARRILVAMA
jgi:alpha-ketoglutarate-dependent taurine dioxygenase